jgi:hypothetical protein
MTQRIVPQEVILDALSKADDPRSRIVVADPFDKPLRPPPPRRRADVRSVRQVPACVSKMSPVLFISEIFPVWLQGNCTLNGYVAERVQSKIKLRGRLG